MAGDAGAYRDQVRAVERRLGDIAGFEDDARQRAREPGAVRRLDSRIGDANLRALAHEMASERKTGQPETEHDCAPAAVARLRRARLTHHSFSVDSPNSTRSMVIIQKR